MLSQAEPAARTVTLRPHPGPQTDFVSSPADIVIYGGAAGGGKTRGVLLDCLAGVMTPGFTAIMFRRTRPQLKQARGLWAQSQEVFRPVGGKPNHADLSWAFPNDVSVKFSHLQYEHTKSTHDGASYTLIVFDELTSFTESQFIFFLSRNRSTCGLPPWIRATCNPDADSWVAKFIAWWIGKDGYPNRERAGVLRWFVRRDDDAFEWADDAATLAEKFPGKTPLSVTFIPSTLDDNPSWDTVDPGYAAKLDALPMVERLRLKGGNWLIRHEAGKVFRRGWFPLVEAAPNGGHDCWFFDMAGTVKKLKDKGGRTNDPDYTAGVLLRVVNGRWYVMDVVAVQDAPANVMTLLLNTAMQGYARSLSQGATFRFRWELEGGSAPLYLQADLASKLAGIDAVGRTTEGKDKPTRALALAAQVQAGNVSVVRAPWNEEFLRNVDGFPDLTHDDIVDAFAGAFNDLPLSGLTGFADAPPAAQAPPATPPVLAGMPRGVSGDPRTMRF